MYLIISSISDERIFPYSKKMLGCLVDPTAGLQVLGHLVGLFSFKTAGLLRCDPAGQIRRLESESSRDVAFR